MFSKDLEFTIGQCYKEAREQRHEFMTVEHLLLALLANLFAPWGIAGAGSGAGGFLLATVLIAAKVAVLALILGGIEVFVAKLRLFRVPELLAGSFVLALLAVTTSSFFASAVG